MDKTLITNNEADEKTHTPPLIWSRLNISVSVQSFHLYFCLCIHLHLEYKLIPKTFQHGIRPTSHSLTPLRWSRVKRSNWEVALFSLSMQKQVVQNSHHSLVQIFNLLFSYCTFTLTTDFRGSMFPNKLPHWKFYISQAVKLKMLQQNKKIIIITDYWWLCQA